MAVGTAGLLSGGIIARGALWLRVHNDPISSPMSEAVSIRPWMSIYGGSESRYWFRAKVSVRVRYQFVRNKVLWKSNQGSSDSG